MKIKLPGVITRAAHRSVHLGKKYAPEILTGAGVVGGVAATVLACKATLNAQEALSEANMELDQVREDKGSPTYGKDLTFAHLNRAKVTVRHYALPIAIGSLSIAAVLTGHGIMRSRQAALVAAYNAVEMAYQNYREKIREEFGVEKDREIVKKITPKEDPGKNADRKKKDGFIPSGHARVFDKYNPNFNSTHKPMNHMFLRTQQSMLNDRLRITGHVTLNEVYKALGFEETNEGMILGWVVAKDTSGFIDFGMYDGHEAANAFINGDEDAIILDFNIDGVIYDRI